MTASPLADPGREAIVRTLERHGVRYVVIGGAAAQARGWLEPTDDIDVTPERSEENLERLAAAVRELEGGFRVDPLRYPDGYQPPGGIDARTFRSQVSLSFTTCHGDFDVVLIPDGTSGYEDIAETATPERLPGTHHNSQRSPLPTARRRPQPGPLRRILPRGGHSLGHRVGQPCDRAAGQPVPVHRGFQGAGQP